MFKQRFIRRRRGVSSVLAMLYLVLFSALAVGFYASVSTAVQVSYNDQRAIQAYGAADSGLEFMRYQLANVTIPSATAKTDVINKLYDNLLAHVDGTLNMPTGSHVVKTGNTINIPG